MKKIKLLVFKIGTPVNENTLFKKSINCCYLLYQVKLVFKKCCVFILTKKNWFSLFMYLYCSNKSYTKNQNKCCNNACDWVPKFKLE